MRIFLAAILILGTLGCTKKLEGEKPEQSYSLGFVLGTQIRDVKDQVDFDFLVRGLRDGLDSKNKLAEGTSGQRLRELESVRAVSEGKRAGENLLLAKKFLDEISKKPGIRKLADGVWFEEKVAPPKTSAVSRERKYLVVSYVAKDRTGKVFDQTGDRNGITIALDQVVMPGLKDALSKIPLGAEWTIYVSPEKAFGVAVRPGLPANSAVVYDIKLHEIKSTAK